MSKDVITLPRTEFADAVKVAWLSGFAEAKKEAENILRQERDAWVRPTGFSYKKALNGLLERIGGIK